MWGIYCSPPQVFKRVVMVCIISCFGRILENAPFTDAITTRRAECGMRIMPSAAIITNLTWYRGTKWATLGIVCTSSTPSPESVAFVLIALPLISIDLLSPRVYRLYWVPIPESILILVPRSVSTPVKIVFALLSYISQLLFLVTPSCDDTATLPPLRPSGVLSYVY